MPIEIELPDGSVAEFPDGTDDATIEGALSQYNFAPAADFSGVTSRVIPDQAGALRKQIAGELSNMSFGQKALIGAGQSFDSTFRGAKQLFNDSNLSKVGIASQGLRGLGMDGMADALDSRVGVPMARTHQEQTALQDQRSVSDDPLLDTGAGLLGAIGGHIAQASVPVGEIGTLTKAVPFLGRMAAAIPVGAFQGAMAPVGSGDSRAQNAAIGAALGPVGEVLGSAAGLAARRASDAAGSIKGQAIAAAGKYGIPLHISQLSDSIPVKAAASLAKYIPFSGAGKAAQKQQAAFNRAVGRTFDADVAEFSDETMASARNSMSKKFQEIYDRNNVPIGSDALSRLEATKAAATEPLLKEEAQVVNRYAQKIADEVRDGEITGAIYQRLRSNLQEAEKRANPGVAAGIKAVRNELDDIAAESVGDADAASLKELRRQWANFRTTENVLKQVQGATGNVKPAALWPAIRKGSTKELRELARIGQAVLKDPIPDSGTPGKLIAASLFSGGSGAATATGGLTGLLSAAPALGGLLVGGATIGRALNSPVAARLVAQQPIARAAGLLAPYLPATGLLAAPVAASANNRRRKSRDDD